MDYSLLVGIHDMDLAESGDDVVDILGLESNDDSDLESPHEADSPPESDSPTEGDMLTETPPTTPPANVNGARERNISFGSNELDEEDGDDTEGFISVDGGLFVYFNFFTTLWSYISVSFQQKIFAYWPQSIVD